LSSNHSPKTSRRIAICQELERFNDRDFNLTISEAAFEFLIRRGIQKTLGARPRRKTVQKFIGDTDIEAMRVSEHLARGQLEALSQTLTALSRESEPEKFLEHILRTIGRQLKAHSIGVWDMNQSTGRTELIANCENDRLHLATPQENQASRVATPPRDHPIWTEFFRSGEQFVFGEIDTEPHRECVSPTGRILHGTIGWEMPWIIRM